MATTKPKSTSVALSYRTRNLETIKSSCERLTPISQAPKGRMQIGGEVTIDQVAGAVDELEVTYEARITVYPPEESEKVSFTASTKVGYTVKFDRPQDEHLSQALLRELVLPLFYVASERCRFLMSSMGYPVKFPPTKFPNVLSKVTAKGDVTKVPKTSRKRKDSTVKAESE